MKSILRLTLLCIALLSSVASWAQVSFTVNAPALTATGQPFRVEFSVDAEPERDSFKAPSFEGFDVIAGPSVSTGHSIQFINGRQSASYSCTYTYVLLPNSAGKFAIEPASITVEGKNYSTTRQLVEVIAEKKGEGTTSNNGRKNPENQISKDDILLRLKVSETSLYKGESLRASLVLYTRANIDNVEDVSIPAFDGFWSQELTFENRPSREEYNGRIYETYKITELLLSPQQSGKIVIPSASLSVRAQVVLNDNGRHDPFFGRRQVYHITRNLKSEPITINVKEFPEGAPVSFKGAVGNYSISYKLPENEIVSNSADQLEITLSGSGNLKFLTAPKVTLPESFEQYETKVVDNIKVSESGTSGSITYTYPFVARSAGEFSIGAVEFCFFNPETQQYKTLSTEPFTISVLDDGTSSSTPIIGNYTNYGGTMRQLDRDIRFIHTNSLSATKGDAFVLTPIFWLIVVAMLSLFAAVYVALSKRIRDNRNVVARRMKHADKMAVKRLRMAEHSMKEGNRHAFFEEMLRAMWGYISDKFNIPVSNLTKETIREELYRRNVSSSLAEQFCEIITRSEEAQYAPSADGEMSDVYTLAIEVISRIEESIKR